MNGSSTTSGTTTAPERRPARSPDAGGPEGGRRHPRRWQLATLVVVALIGGIGVGRLTTTPVSEGAFDARPAPSVRTLADHIADLEDRSQRQPDDAGTWLALGAAYVQRVAQTGDPSTYAPAEAAFDRAEELGADGPETDIGRATLALSRHRFDRALALAEAALSERPRNTAAMLVAVDANVELGRYDAAAEHLQALLDTRPALPALARTSYLRELHGDLEGALSAMERARTAGSGAPYDLATVTTLVGDLHLRAGRLDEAADSYRAALDTSDGLPHAEFGLARTEAARGELDAAIERLEQLVERAPLPGAAILLSDLQARAGDAEGAEASDELVRALLALQEEAGQVVDLELALFEADRGQGRRALALAERTYDERPTVFAADAIAWALHVTGDDAAAVPFVEEALRLGTKDGLLHFHAATVFAATGNDDRARASLRTVFEHDPWFSFRHQAAARRLADGLDLTPPAAWNDSA